MNATLPKPRLIDPASVPAFRWGAVGAGWIVSKFTQALHAHTAQRIRAVATRSPSRAAAFAAEYGIDRVHQSVEALVADPGVDVVHVGTPHSSHHAVALRAIAAGKHVLVEKPFALSASEGAEIADAARAGGVFAMEAMWTGHLPQSDVIRQLLADGAVGDVDLVMADFGFIAPFDREIGCGTRRSVAAPSWMPGLSILVRLVRDRDTVAGDRIRGHDQHGRGRSRGRPAQDVEWSDRGTLMWDPATGGAYDGLTQHGANINQGAESTLALISTLQQARRVS
jgi:hypothetical protein